MASYAETKVFEALMSRLSDMSLTPAMAVAWPDREFARPDSGWVEPTLLPAETSIVGVGHADSRQFMGVLQISIYLPEESGMTVGLERAGAVADHFKKGTKIDREGVRVKIENPPVVEQPVPEPGWVQYPVSVPYRAYV